LRRRDEGGSDRRRKKSALGPSRATETRAKARSLVRWPPGA